jgi:hypothetical protein
MILEVRLARASGGWNDFWWAGFGIAKAVGLNGGILAKGKARGSLALAEEEFSRVRFSARGRSRSGCRFRGEMTFPAWSLASKARGGFRTS